MNIFFQKLVVFYTPKIPRTEGKIKRAFFFQICKTRTILHALIWVNKTMAYNHSAKNYFSDTLRLIK